MPVSRSHLTRPKPRSVRIDLGEGDELNIIFDSNRITPAWIDAAVERDNERDVYSLPKALAEVIISWDVSEDDGSEFLPTAANIGVFSYLVQSSLLEAITGAAVPARAEGEVSGEPSSPPPRPTSPGSGEQPSASQPMPQNGAATSPSPAPSESLSPR